MVPFRHAGGVGVLEREGDGDGTREEVALRVGMADGSGERVTGGRVAVGEAVLGVGRADVAEGAGGLVAAG